GLPAPALVTAPTPRAPPAVPAAAVAAALRERAGAPLVVLDLGVPRDVEPEVRGLPGVVLADLDALRGVLDSAEGPRGRGAPVVGLGGPGGAPRGARARRGAAPGGRAGPRPDRPGDHRLPERPARGPAGPDPPRPSGPGQIGRVVCPG